MTALTHDPEGLRAALAALDPVAAAAPDTIRVVHAPGRVNLIGEHTDYNQGFVLPVAISLGISIALVPTDDRRVELTLAETGERGILDLDAIGDRTGAWIDYVAGTAWSLLEAGVPVRGFRGLLASDLPPGSGLSSSAALELASAWALAGGTTPALDPLSLARVAQRGENSYVGVSSGLMDQFASSCGVAGSALLLDCRSLAWHAVPMPPDLRIVVCHTGSTRRLDGSSYNARVAECRRAVEAVAAVEGPAIRTLRDIDARMLARGADRMDPVARRRAEHVVAENDRVLATEAALQAGDGDAIGRLFAASHRSMRDLFEISSPELDALVDIAVATPGVVGARMTGGGFGGCTVNLVGPDAVDALRSAVERDYPGRTGRAPRVWEVAAVGGAGPLAGLGPAPASLPLGRPERKAADELLR
jgi:galactokinase